MLTVLLTRPTSPVSAPKDTNGSVHVTVILMVPIRSSARTASVLRLRTDTPVPESTRSPNARTGDTKEGLSPTSVDGITRVVVRSKVSYQLHG